LVDSPVSDEDVDEDLEDPDADVIQPATEATTTTIKQLETFGGIPAFPREAIKEAQKSLKGYYKHVLSKDDANSTSSSNSISPTTVEGAQVSESAIPPEALLPNQAVLRRQDEPILPHTNNLTTESSPEELKIVMEGESLRQLEESHIISPAKETGKSKEEKPPDEPAEAPKPKRGRPKKNTPEV
jgi:hypothetical protein